jgi:hypothetical protein
MSTQTQRSDGFGIGASFGLMLVFFVAMPIFFYFANGKAEDEFTHGVQQGQCDADCRWVHDEGRYDGPVHGEYDKADQTCSCIRVLEAPSP